MGVAGASILAGEDGACIGTDAAVLAGEAQGAGAGKVIDAIHAGTGVAAGVVGAVIVVDLAARPSEARTTTTHQTVAQIQALATVSTRAIAAAVNLLLAVGAHVAGRTAAGVTTGGHLLHAGATIEAGPVGTGHRTDLTVLPVEALGACAGVVILQIIAAASVLAGVAVTLVGFDLTIVPTEARPACTGVAALACVGAGSIVRAGLVVGAVVEVLVAEQSSPALFTVALPRLATGAMQAARIADTLVTEGSLPPEAALALAWGLTITMLLIAARRADGF